MALGNNLKKIKKDSLIPAKKKAAPKNKAKATNTAEPNIAPKAKPVSKPSVKAKPIAKKSVAKTKAEAKTAKPVSKIEPPIAAANLDERVLVGGNKDSKITAKLFPSRRKTVRKTKLVFEGSMSFQEAQTIKDCLLTTFTEYDLIDIKLTNITHLDIIPIQLFKAFVNGHKDKKVKIDSEIPFDIKIILERAGYGSFMFKEEVA